MLFVSGQVMTMVPTMNPDIPSPRILSIGSVNIDLTAYSPALPRAGETIHATRYATGLGGKGANQAAACARLAGAACGVALVGRVGKDAFGTQARESLSKFGTDCRWLSDDAGNGTGLALIGIDARGENCITVIGASNMAVDVGDLDRAQAAIAGARVVMLQLEIPMPAVIEAARRARAAGAIVLLDPAPAPHDGLPDALWAEIDVVTPNETETERLVGLRPRDAAQAADAGAALRAKGARAAVVKLGANGVYWCDATGSGFIHPFAVTAIDTVAAGDCFNAGLALSLSEGRPLGQAVRFAAACGALATTKRGAADAAPERAEVEALLLT
ncbi:ribokinase [Tanticharoenia sakaeratensis NBRC 103193]|uniref:Ribokinase n=2 Tax=Tanticharoenia TaxID=444052 RepID=A0A0D6ML62_9PROT|nr:ribokinase [Tanticharoenia sakaeratensis NBRC 103193]